MAVAKALGSNFDYMAPMLYDFPEANQSNYGAVCVAKCDIMAAAGIPQSKMILGFMMKPPAENYPNASDSWQKTRDAYNAVKAKYPNLRGAFMWEDKIMAARDGTGRPTWARSSRPDGKSMWSLRSGRPVGQQMPAGALQATPASDPPPWSTG